MQVPRPVTSLTFENSYSVLHIDGGETVTAKCVLIATGADYRRLTAAGCESFEGKGRPDRTGRTLGPLDRQA